MKKGDQVKKIEHLVAGTEVAHNFSSLIKAEEWGKTTKMPLRAEESTEFPGTFHVVLREGYDLVERGNVQWVVNDEMSILDLDTGLFHIVEIKDWEVEIEGTPAYQSTVENLSEQQLRDSIESLRSQRRTAPRVSIKAPRAPRVKEDPMLKVLSKLGAEERAALEKKLGLV